MLSSPLVFILLANLSIMLGKVFIFEFGYSRPLNKFILGLLISTWSDGRPGLFGYGALVVPFILFVLSFLFFITVMIGSCRPSDDC